MFRFYLVLTDAWGDGDMPGVHCLWAAFAYWQARWASWTLLAKTARWVCLWRPQRATSLSEMPSRQHPMESVTPLPEGYGIRTGLSDLLKPLNAEAGVVAKEDSIPTVLVMLTGIVLLFLFYLLLLLIDNQSVLLPPEDEFDEYVANFLPYFFFGEKWGGWYAILICLLRGESNDSCWHSLVQSSCICHAGICSYPQ